jgi:hypothetical protein
VEPFLSIAGTIMDAIPFFFLNPFLYLFVLLIFLQYRRLVLFERKLFHVRVNYVGQQMLHTLAFGLLGGITISTLTVGLGIMLTMQDVYVVLTLSVLLALLHIQYLCFAYAAGIAGMIAGFVKLWPQGGELLWFAPFWGLFQNLHIESLLALAAVLHLLEAAWLFIHAGKGLSPSIISSKRGMLIGAYQSQQFWLLPLFSLTVLPVAEGGVQWTAGWWPWTITDALPGIGLLLFPVVIGSSNLFVSSKPLVSAHRTALHMLIFALLLLFFAYLATRNPWITMAASVFAVVGHEALVRWQRWQEWRRPPSFVHPRHGVFVLDVVAHSPADLLGIEREDVILRINGKDISRNEDVYAALALHPQYCKMEVSNSLGHVKYLQRSIYQADHHQLGLILAPDEQFPYYIDVKPSSSIIKLIKQRIDQ